jgi:phage terminase small subunit
MPRKRVKPISPDDDGFGPAMRDLNERQREFVIGYVEQPTRALSAIAASAGYSTGGKSGVGIRTQVNRMLRNEKILKAVREELDKRFRSDAVIGRAVLLEIALDKAHPHRLKAAMGLLNRGGFHELHESVVHMQHTDMTAEGMIERITALAGELNLDPRKLLGANWKPDTVTIEAAALPEPKPAPAPAAPAARVVRFVERSMVREYVKVGWTAPKDDPGTDLVEVIWTGDNPVTPDTRPLMRPDLFSAR